MLSVAFAPRAGAPPLSVIIPAYNEASRLPPMLEASLQYLRAERPGAEIIVVDDGSTDGTADVVREAAARHAATELRLLRTPVNLGKGSAVVAGALAARGDQVLLADADGATPLSALPLLESELREARCGVVVGSRASVLSLRPWRRRLMGAVFSAVSRLCVSGVEDTQCGFKLLTREAARATLPQLRVSGWAFDVEMLMVAQALGHRIGCARVPWTDVAGSKIRWHTPLEMLLDVLAVALCYRLGLWRVAQPPGDGDEDDERAVRPGSKRHGQAGESDAGARGDWAGARARDVLAPLLRLRGRASTTNSNTDGYAEEHLVCM